MSFQQPTYEKALQAIAQGDVDALKRLISKDVHDDGPKHRARMENMVRQAAQRGHTEMVHHLAHRAILREDHYLQRAWAVGMEFGHTDMAHFILFQGGRPRPRFPERSRFNHACREHAWTAVSHLIDQEGYTPSDVDLLILFSELRSFDGPLPSRLLPLGYRVPAEQLDDVLMVAMRAGREALFTDALNRIDTLQLTSNVGELLLQAVASGRYDWAKRLDEALRPSWSDDAWIEGVISHAVDTHQLGFIQDALNDRPSLVARIRNNVAGTGPGKFFGHRLVTRADDDEAPATRELRIRLLQKVYPDDSLDHVRAQIEASSFQGERGVYLNRLALWAPDAVRERWFQEAPVTFAQAIATVRSAQHTQDTQVPAQSRPRVRV